MGQPDACATAAVQSYDTLKEDKYEQLMIDMEEGRRDSLSNYVYQVIKNFGTEESTMADVERIFSVSRLHEFPNSYGHTALVTAARLGKMDIVKYLVVEKGADPLTGGDDGANALHWSVILGHENIARYFVDRCDVDLDCVDGDGNNSVHYASCCGHLHLLQWLVEVKGMHPNKKNKLGRTPLWWANAKKQTKIVRYLTRCLDALPPDVAELTAGEAEVTDVSECAEDSLASTSGSCSSAGSELSARSDGDECSREGFSGDEEDSEDESIGW